MNKSVVRKQKLYDIYARNLSWVKAHPSISFEPDFTTGYICPLCFELFGKDDLSETCVNPLTFDHNPPKALGGRQGVLTCKECNSKAGHKLDAHLLMQLNERDFLEFSPNAKARTNLTNTDNRVAADISIDDEGKITINIDTKNSDPKQTKFFLAHRTYTYRSPLFYDFDALDAGTTWKMHFDMKLLSKSEERLAEIALLKIAYLIAFQRFGFGFLINSGLYAVREQILNPTKEILPKVFWIKYQFPKECLGVNIINRPKELQCFLIVFNLITQSSERQFAIVLPGLSDLGIEVYNNIQSLLCNNEITSIPANIEHLVERDYILEEEWAFAPISIWNSLVA